MTLFKNMKQIFSLGSSTCCWFTMIFFFDWTNKFNLINHCMYQIIIPSHYILINLVKIFLLRHQLKIS